MSVACRLLVALTVAAVVSDAAIAAAVGPRSFKLVVYDFKQRTADTVDYATYHANLRAQVLAAAGDFAADKPTLALLPENTGLMAWMVGPRGGAARAAADSGDPNSSAAAIAALGPQYAPAISSTKRNARGSFRHAH